MQCQPLHPWTREDANLWWKTFRKTPKRGIFTGYFERRRYGRRQGELKIERPLALPLVCQDS